MTLGRAYCRGPVKRVFDVAISVAALIVLAPVFLIVSVIVLLASGRAATGPGGAAWADRPGQRPVPGRRGAHRLRSGGTTGDVLPRDRSPEKTADEPGVHRPGQRQLRPRFGAEDDPHRPLAGFDLTAPPLTEMCEADAPRITPAARGFLLTMR